MKNLEKLLDWFNNKGGKDAYNNGDPSHDYLHVLRVLENAERIARHNRADLNILIPAVLLHDIVFVPKNSPDRAKASEICADKAGTILREFGYSGPEIKHIQQVILEHSFSRGLKASSPESEALQDADRLDAVGAIGIMRTVSTGVLMKCQYYNIQDILGQDRTLDDKAFTIDHFLVKLFRLPHLMNTEYAKDEALRRVQFMKDFLKELTQEING